MFKHFVLFLLIGLAINVRGQVVNSNNQLVIGTVDSVSSSILKETRKVWVYVPKGADDTTYSKKKYPVLYLLDGESHFTSVTGIIQQLSQVNGNTVLPEMIVVGICNTDRMRDLTPTNSLKGLDGKTEPYYKGSGGGELFSSFIARELKPYIESHYPTAPYRVLVGHSLGGLMAINTLIKHTNLFNGYVAIDPSMWWDDQNLLKQVRYALPQKNLNGKALYLGIANTMVGIKDTLTVRSDTLPMNGHIRAILHLKDAFQSNPNPGLQFNFAYYANDGHGSIPLLSEYDALHAIFKYYPLPTGLDMAMADSKSNINLAGLLAEHYQKISKHLGYTVYPPGNKINSYAKYYLQTGQADKAYALFALNIKNYPTSFQVYDSMGDYYAQLKNKGEALQFYKKALAINDSTSTKAKIDTLIKQ